MQIVASLPQNVYRRLHVLELDIARKKATSVHAECKFVQLVVLPLVFSGNDIRSSAKFTLGTSGTGM